jgi:hypothetical protein
LGADCVRNLTADQRAKVKLVDHNVIATLVAMSRDDNESVKCSCVQAFYNLSKDINCREKIVHGHAVSVIIKMSMEKFQNIEMGRTAARTLRVLCGDRNVALLLIRDGIVKALMSLISKDDAHMKDDGVMIVHVPNANAINRKLNVIMGSLVSCDELSPFDLNIAGHRRSYTLDSLEKEVKEAGLKVTSVGGIFLKMLSAVISL